MKKLLLIPVAVFAAILIAYGAGTTVNGTRIINGDLTVKGTCTGCGGGLSVTGNYLTDGSGNYYVTSPALALITRTTCGSLTWRNQGTATCTDNADGSITMNSGTAAASDNLRILEQTPGSTFTATIHLTCDLQAVQFLSGGIAMVETGTGKVVIWSQSTDTAVSGNYHVKRANWNSVSSFANETNFTYNGAPKMAWMRVQLTASNLVYYVSDDGTLWKQWLSESKTNFFTSAPNRVGVFVNANNASVTSTCTTRSWSVI